MELILWIWNQNDATSNARYGLVAIDNFTKIAEVVPIKNRTLEAMIEGLK